MDKNTFFEKLKALGLHPAQEALILRELKQADEHHLEPDFRGLSSGLKSLYEYNDPQWIQGLQVGKSPYALFLQTIDELLERDKQRELDGFPRRIRLGKLVKPAQGRKGDVVIVPTTTESKFFHGDTPQEEQESETGGTGEGEIGEVLGEQPIQPQGGEGEGSGAGQGSGGEHDMTADAFDLGRILTEKFELPNLKDKGKKKSLTKYQYDLTDIHHGLGQILDKKATLRKVIETNIQLGNIQAGEEFAGENLVLSPQDKVYRILSKEPDYDSQAVVFFLRDYSGSMHGKPTEVITSQHLFIYSWLMYQYKSNVMSRFILHDTEAKEVEDFYTYYKSTVAGGTNVYPAFELVHKIVEEEQLAREYNIYVFHGTDGDDWESSGEQTLDIVRQILRYASRVGITVAKNNWSGYGDATTVERYFEESGLLKEYADLLRLDSMMADKATENRVIEGIKRLVA
ncbi:MAG: DUF444 family protein [Microscillaceae bacterium]|nr:DUF444 family protein [Microscillaceae bacterium]